MRQILVDFGTLHLFGREIPLRLFGYGLMLVLGFLTAIALAQWRALRNGESPDAITQCGILALIGGVLGARAAYVIQHWRSQFSEAPNPLLAVLNITSGGLIYYGGVALAALLVIGYLFLKHLPVRRYLDIMAPSLMVGLAFGRVGCLLNGCCFGAAARPDWPLAVRFPMYSQPLVKLDGRANPFSQGSDSASPIYAYQLERGTVQPDDRLVNQALKELLSAEPGGSVSALLPPRDLHGRLGNDQLGFLELDRQAAEKEFRALAGGDGAIHYDKWRKALGRSSAGGGLAGSEQWAEALAFETRRDGKLDFSEFWAYVQWRQDWAKLKFAAADEGELNRKEANDFLQADQIALAVGSRSGPVLPAQVLGATNAILLAGLLLAFHRLRRREGQVFAALMVLYPVSRFVLESIRDENAHDLLRGILTHNQYTSLVIAAAGLAWLAFLQRRPASAGPTWDQRMAGGKAARGAVR